jgi:hypothetical protein
VIGTAVINTHTLKGGGGGSTDKPRA